MQLLPIRAPLTAFLTLGALLCALPSPADPPSVRAVSQAQWQKLPLQHVIPSQILKAMKWDVAANLPPGVTRVYALAGDNALFVQATPDGFSHVHDIVNNLDIAPRQVQVKMTLAWATATDLEASGVELDTFTSPAAPTTLMGSAIGPEVFRLAEALRQKGAVLQSPVITTSNNVPASLGISSQPLGILPVVDSVTFSVTPRVNSDDSMNLVLGAQATWRVAGKTNPDGTPVLMTQGFQSNHIVRNGDTLVLANVFPGAAGADGRQLVLFVTSKFLSDDGGSSPAAVGK